MMAFYLILAIIAGFCTALQSPTNATLSRYAGHLQATCVSFGGGVICLAVLMFLVGTGDLSNIVNAPWWNLLGGVYGVCIVLAITFAIPKLGAALTSTILMLGQLTTATVLDTFGLMGLDAVPLATARVLGCVIVLAGIVLVYVGKRKQENGKPQQKGIAAIVAALLFAGFSGAVQAPTNNALSTVVGRIEASFMSFAIGFVVIFVITLIVTKGQLFKNKKEGIQWWMFTGGIYGAAMVYIGIVAVPYLGSAILMIATMLGQLSGGLLVDSFGLLRTNKIKANSWRWAGMIIIAVGVVLIAVTKL
jgi:transporter family-2 protein